MYTSRCNAAKHLLANHEGISAVPASAASHAGVIKSKRSHLVKSRQNTVCAITWHGLKNQKATANFAGLQSAGCGSSSLPIQFELMYSPLFRSVDRIDDRKESDDSEHGTGCKCRKNVRAQYHEH